MKPEELECWISIYIKDNYTQMIQQHTLGQAMPLMARHVIARVVEECALEIERLRDANFKAGKEHTALTVGADVIRALARKEEP